jgi:LuxR family quorum sensing-dependent transcriptional regulator
MAAGQAPFVDQTFEVIDALERLTDPDAIVGKLADCLGGFGFNSFLITGLPTQRERFEPYVLLNTWPSGWYERYTQANHYRHDPCARQCFSTIEPFAWDELPDDAVSPEKSRQVMDEATEFGLAHGFCVPLHNLYGFQAVVTMAGEKVDMPPGARRMVHLLSLYAYGAAERLDQPVTYHDWNDRLTPRETEVLRWIAVGKTAQDVGDILGISDFTVTEHLRHVRRKFGTTNTVHSVVEALKRRQLRL